MMRTSILVAGLFLGFVTSMPVYAQTNSSLTVEEKDLQCAAALTAKLDGKYATKNEQRKPEIREALMFYMGRLSKHFDWPKASDIATKMVILGDNTDSVAEYCLEQKVYFLSSIAHN